MTSGLSPFQAQTILAARGHLFGSPAFQVDLFGWFHLAKSFDSRS
jgi:hypothetical protein